MYKSFYHLNENPFNLNPDPHFLFPSQQQKNAFQYLMYGINNCEGLIEVVGEVGCGKTLLCHRILASLKDKAKTAYIFSPPPTETEFLKSLMEDLGLPSENKNRQELIQNLSNLLADEYAHDSRVVVIIDEAQDFSNQLFATIRFLTNLETEKKKLIQIILVGQMELDVRLHTPELRALDQRIALRYQLTPLNQKELKQYIYHRLETAGTQEIKFTGAALRKIYRFSRGIPRLINIVCDKALVAGCLAKQSKITGGLVTKALQSTQRRLPDRSKSSFLSPLRLAGGFACCACLLLTLAFTWYSQRDSFAFLTSKKSDHRVEKANFVTPASELPGVNTVKMLSDIPEVELARVRPEAIALTNLFRRWGYDVAPDEFANWPMRGANLDYKAVAQEYGLEAAFLDTNFKELQIINLPCIIFPDEQGQNSLPSALFLSKLSGGQVHLLNASYPADRLASWQGKALILWENTDNFRAGEIALNKNSRELEQLAKRLQQLGYLDKKTTNAQHVRRALWNFQQDHFLPIKASIDTRTKLVLYKIINQPTTPTLTGKFI